MAKMRAPGGCPWDRKQTLGSLKQYLVEECYEVIDAIDSGDPDRHADELGDLLLQVVFQSQIRAERKQFDFEDVVKRICAKLVRRHPHVFGKKKVRGQAEVLRNWEKIKAEEKRLVDRSGGPAASPVSVAGNMPRHLPALHKAHHLQQRLARVGFDWTDVRGVILKVEEELEEVKEAIARGDARQVRAEAGDLLFACVNLCRFRRMNAEEVLQEAVSKFTRRFQAVEERVRAEGRQISQCTLSELDKHWEAVKKAEEARERQKAQRHKGKERKK